MKNNLKRMFLVGIGLLCLTTPTFAGSELAAGVTPKFSDVYIYHKFNGTGPVRNMEQIWNSSSTYMTARNANGSGLSYVPGKLNQALQFDGIDDFLENGGGNTEKTTYSMAFWVKKSVGTGISTVLQRGDSRICFYNPNISIDNATGVLSVSESGCGGTGLVAKGTLGNDYTHVVVVRSLQDVSLYMNGGLIKKLVKSSFPASGPTNGRTVVGAQFGSSPNIYKNFFKGSIDDLSMYHTALTLADVQALYKAQISQYSYGSFERPFAPDSYWNSTPVDPVLGSVAIPNYAWFPVVAGGDYSSSVYNAQLSDPPMTVTANDSDSYESGPIIIPHWPANVTPAQGTDGHADIVDMSTGFIHSFWILRKDATSGKWTANSYSKTKVKASGFGDPAHSQAGARAAGVVTMAGMIRTHEIDDGEPMYKHALALSLDGDTFKKNVNGKQSFEFPATAEDNNSMTKYTKVDGFAMGSLLMLPKTFNVASLKLPRLQKVARTLMNYGAYVVDQNTDTPFVIYVQNNSNYSNNPGFMGSWDGDAANDLRVIQNALRKVTSNAGYTDANGNKFVPNKKVNILSMRGQWVLPTGPNSRTVGGSGFDTYKQALAFAPAAKGMTFNNWYNNEILKPVNCSWACKKPGVSYRFKVKATNGAKMVFKIRNAANTAYIIDTGLLGDGQYKDFIMPADNATTFLQAVNGTVGAADISGELIEN